MRPSVADGRTAAGRYCVCLASCRIPITDTHSQRYLDALLEAGFRVVSITPGAAKGSSRWEHFELPSPQRMFGYKSGLRNALLALRERRRASSLLKAIIDRVQPDAYLVSEPDAWMVAVRAKAKYGGVVVADLREVYEERALAFPRFLQGLVRLLVRRASVYLSRRSDEIIHVSEARQSAYSYLDKAGRVIGLYPAVEEFPSRDPAHHIGGADGVTAVHAGALRHNYASNELLRAVELVRESAPEFKLLIFGGVRGDLKSRDLLSRLEADGAVVMVEHSPFSEVLAAMVQSDLGISLVLPVDLAHRLAEPRKFYEYLAAGLPVIAADVPTLRRVIEQHGCGRVVDATSPDSIASGVLSLTQDSALRRGMSRKALIAAKTKFNWEREKPKFQAIFLQRLKLSVDG